MKLHEGGNGSFRCQSSTGSNLVALDQEKSEGKILLSRRDLPSLVTSYSPYSAKKTVNSVYKGWNRKADESYKHRP